MSTEPALQQRPLNLKRHLITRVFLFALVVLLAGTAFALIETRYRVQADIERTGQTIQRLIADEIRHNSNPYNDNLTDIDLSLDNLEAIGKHIHFCIRLSDLYSRAVGERCFDDPVTLPYLLEEVMRHVIGADTAYEGSIGQYPGVTFGHLTITPNYGREWITLGKNLINLLLVSLAILFMSFFIYRPVRNALAPTDAMLQTLKCLENGDLHARMPTFALIELDRIGQGFNHLAERLQQTIGIQQRLARRLLDAREEERLHLSRELHDELGQYLASLNAEASFVRELADEGIPALRPAADSIRRTVSHMMEVLQQILHRLRPLGLEEFGLHASLQQLVDEWNRRAKGNTTFQLLVDEIINRLPDNIAVTLYRIVQEGITNAVRHGAASSVEIRLTGDMHNLQLQIIDNGLGGIATIKKTESNKPGGFGLLGMEERVLALGGRLHILPGKPQGTIIDVHLTLGEDA